MARVTPEYVILGLLESQSCHGYQLLEHFRQPERLGRIWKLSNSRIYSLLKTLERKEWIDGREEDSVDAPMRTVYWLTNVGRAHLYDWLNVVQPSASTRNIRTEFLSRLYIARILNQPIQPIIDAQRHACEAQLDQLNALASEDDADSIGELALALQIDEMRVITTWLDRCQQTFVEVTD